MSVESKHYWDQKSTQDEEHLILPDEDTERDGKWDRADDDDQKYSIPLLEEIMLLAFFP